MDGTRTLYIKGLSNVPEETLKKSFKPLGLERWRVIDDEGAFAQFASLAHVKIALELLPKLSLNGNQVVVKVSEKTRKNIDAMASKASVQSLTRMSSESLRSRLQRSISSQMTCLESNSKQIKPDGHLPDTDPDGTLKDELFPESIETLRKEVRQFRIASRKLAVQKALTDRESLEKVRKKILSGLSSLASYNPEPDDFETFTFQPYDEEISDCPDAAFEGFMRHIHAKKEHLERLELAVNGQEERILEKSSVLDFPEMAKTVAALNMLPSKRLETRAREIEQDKVLAKKEGTKESKSENLESTKAMPSPHFPAVDNSQSNLSLTIAKVIEDFFGESDESLCQHIESHVAKHGSSKALIDDLKPIFEEDAAKFVESLYAQLSATG